MEKYSKEDGCVLVGLLMNNEPVLTPDENFIIPAKSKAILICTNQKEDERKELIG